MKILIAALITLGSFAANADALYVCANDHLSVQIKIHTSLLGRGSNAVVTVQNSSKQMLGIYSAASSGDGATMIEQMKTDGLKVVRRDSNSRLHALNLQAVGFYQLKVPGQTQLLSCGGRN